MIQHVKRIRPLLQNGFLLHHKDARPHIAHCVLDVSQQKNVEILPHPSYSPDKTPCDFWLFPQLKKPLRGKRFASNKTNRRSESFSSGNMDLSVKSTDAHRCLVLEICSLSQHE
ncbi:histone-lysine N-methyltransferase SETMAR [Trichonephila clavipes]|nr:histone-lysine N-methyltransferase SETMAR [Trichonephila clavipes]